MNKDIEILKHSFKTIQLVLVEKIRAGSHIQTDRDLVTHCCFTIQKTYLNWPRNDRRWRLGLADNVCGSKCYNAKLFKVSWLGKPCSDLQERLEDVKERLMTHG